MNKIRAASLATMAMAMVALAGCGGSASPAPSAPARQAVSATPSAVSSPSPTVPAGCLQATAVAAAIRSKIEQSPSDVSGSALRQLQSMARTLPTGFLRVDVDRAALDLALFREYEAMGGPVSKAARRFAADLNRITRKCTSA